MQTYLLAAGVIAVLVGVIHSVLGELLIFSRMRNNKLAPKLVPKLVPTEGAPLLRERHVRILWASWHLGSVFGWALAALLLRMAFPVSPAAFQAFAQNTIAVATLGAALLVLFATNGKHPGWIGLLAVSALTLLS